MEDRRVKRLKTKHVFSDELSVFSNSDLQNSKDSKHLVTVFVESDSDSKESLDFSNSSSSVSVVPSIFGEQENERPVAANDPAKSLLLVPDEELQEVENFEIEQKPEEKISESSLSSNMESVSTPDGEVDTVIEWIINENRKMDEERIREEHLIDRVFGNHLVASRIFQYLPDKDLREAALVRKNWTDGARYVLRKTRRSIVKLKCHPSYSSIVEFNRVFAGCSSCPFNGISISCNVLNCQKNVDLMLPSGCKLTYLHLNLLKGSCCDGMKACHKLFSQFYSTIEELHIDELPSSISSISELCASIEKNKIEPSPATKMANILKLCYRIENKLTPSTIVRLTQLCKKKDEQLKGSSSSSETASQSSSSSGKMILYNLKNLTLPSCTEKHRGHIEPSLVKDILGSSPKLENLYGAVLPGLITPLKETSHLNLLQNFHFRVRSIEDLNMCSSFIDYMETESLNNDRNSLVKRKTKPKKATQVTLKEITFSNCGMAWASVAPAAGVPPNPNPNLRGILSSNIEMILQRNTLTLTKIQIDPYSLLVLSRLLHRSDNLKLESVQELQLNMDIKHDFLLSYFSLRTIDFATKLPKLSSVLLSADHYVLSHINLAELMHNFRLSMRQPGRGRVCLNPIKLKLIGHYPVLLVNVIPKMKSIFVNVKNLHIHNHRADEMKVTKMKVGASAVPSNNNIGPSATSAQYFFNNAHGLAHVASTPQIVSALAKRQTSWSGDGFPHILKSIWSSWLDLESLKFTGVQDGNICWGQGSSCDTFDSVVTGIPEMHCHWLRNTKNYSEFENLQSSLSIRNLKKLTKLEIEIDHKYDLFYGSLNPSYLPELFLTEVSGVCAFSQMPDLNVQISRKKCNFTSKCCFLQLNSISPFVSICDRLES